MELVTAINIKGKQFIRKELTANDYFEYEKRKINQSVSLANEWLIYEAFGKCDLSELRFRDRGRLLLSLTNATAIKHDDLSLAESSDFSVGGNRYIEKEDSGDFFDQFIAKASNNSIDAFKWIIPKVFLKNGNAIAPLDFEKPAPDGIGFEGAAILVQWLSGFLSPQ